MKNISTNLSTAQPGIIYILTGLLVLFLSQISFSQIIIEERVEVDPQVIVGDYPVSAFDPCVTVPTNNYEQVIYSCSSFPIEPYQQLYPFQSGTSLQLEANTSYEVEITEGTGFASFSRIAYTDSSGVFHEEEELGSYIYNLTGSELSGTGDYTGLQATGTFIRENISLYRINFNNYANYEANVTMRITRLDNMVATYWHTIVVNPQLQIDDIVLEYDTLPHFYSMDVGISLFNINSPCDHPGFGGCPPEDITFNIEIIQGEEYGSIKFLYDGYMSSSITDIEWSEIDQLVYYANGDQPDSTGIVTIRQSSDDPDILPMEFSFIVKRNSVPPQSEGGSIYVELDKNDVLPGDTVNIFLQYIDEVHDTSYFPPFQTFQVELSEGSQYGTIVDLQTGETGDYIEDASANLMVIIDEEIQENETQIVFVAQTDILLFGSPMQINSSNNQKFVKQTVDKTDRDEEPITDFIFIGEHLIGAAEINVTRYPFMVEILPPEIAPGDTAEIIPLRKDENGNWVNFPANQQFEIGMLDGCTLGKISAGGMDTNYVYGVTQPLYFVADTSADSGAVLLRVGLIDTAGTNQSLKGNDPPRENPANFCFINNYQSSIYKDGEILVGGGCGTLNVCFNDPYPEFVQYNIIPGGITHNNPNIFTPNVVDPITGMLNIQVGGFSALDWRFERSQRIEAEACYDNGEKNVRFIMNLTDVETGQNSLVLKPEAIFEICESNISNAGLILISNTDQVLNIIRQFPEQIPIIKADMDSTLSRYNASVEKYKFREEIIAHETEHKKDYEFYLDTLKNDWLNRRVKEYTLSCSQFRSDPYANELANTEYLKIVSEYIDKSNMVAHSRTNEIEIQQRLSVQASLSEYYNLLYKFENEIIF